MRRRTLVLSVGAAGAAGAGALWLRRHGETPPTGVTAPEHEPLLARKLRQRLPMLNIPPAVLAEFTKDHESQHGKFKGRRAHQSVVQTFLLSTDFFPDADEARPLQYVGYYDPYLGPCRNPFRGT